MNLLFLSTFSHFAAFVAILFVDHARKNSIVFDVVFDYWGFCLCGFSIESVDFRCCLFHYFHLLLCVSCFVFGLHRFARTVYTVYIAIFIQKFMYGTLWSGFSFNTLVLKFNFDSCSCKLHLILKEKLFQTKQHRMFDGILWHNEPHRWYSTGFCVCVQVL